MTNAAIASEIQKLAPSAIVELFVLDLNPIGVNEVLRFHAGTNQLTQNIVWQGQTYVAYPVQATEFEQSTNGQIPRPKLRVANVQGAITALVLLYNDLLGAKITRKRTLAKFLDAVNFPDGNPTADQNAQFADDVYFIDRKATETREVVDFELAASLDVQNVMLPRRQMIQNTCTWRYRGAECGYTGNAYFNKSDAPVGTLAQDECGKRLTSCKRRFGEGELPYGGFPAVGKLRV